MSSVRRFRKFIVWLVWMASAYSLCAEPLVVTRQEVEYDSKGRLHLIHESVPYTGLLVWDGISADVDEPSITVARYVEGLEDGLQTTYRSERKEKIEHQYTAVAGLKNGPEVHFLYGGNISAITMYQNGVIHGRDVHFSNDERVGSVFQYMKGFKHGPFVRYNKGGVKELGHFFMGFPDGDWFKITKGKSELIYSYDGSSSYAELLKVIGWTEDDFYAWYRFQELSKRPAFSEKNRMRFKQLQGQVDRIQRKMKEGIRGKGDSIFKELGSQIKGGASDMVLMRFRFSSVLEITEYELREGGEAIEYNIMHPAAAKEGRKDETPLFSVSIKKWGEGNDGLWIEGAINDGIRYKLNPINEGKYIIGEAVYMKVDSLMYNEKFKKMSEGYVPSSGDKLSAPWVKFEAKDSAPAVGK